MADYTDIDKLREQTRDAEPSTGPWTPFAYEDGPAPRTFVTDGQGRRHHVFSENAAQHLNQRDAAVAEIVGLRTEVDQLRSENVELERLHGSAPLLRSDLRAAVAERDALQAEVERLTAQVEAGRTINNQFADQSGRDGQALLRKDAEIRALQARIDAVNDLFIGGPDASCRTRWEDGIECVSVPLDDLRAALGVDPQKEEQA